MNGLNGATSVIHASQQRNAARGGAHIGDLVSWNGEGVDVSRELARLASGAAVPDAEASEILTMTDALRKELPKMLDELKQIRAAVDGLRQAAKSEGSAKYQELADHLALHARNEEEVLYPAAIVVGDVIRLRRSGK